MAMDIIFIGGIYCCVCVFVRDILLLCENQYVWVLPDVVCSDFSFSLAVFPSSFLLLYFYQNVVFPVVLASSFASYLLCVLPHSAPLHTYLVPLPFLWLVSRCPVLLHHPHFSLQLLFWIYDYVCNGTGNFVWYVTLILLSPFCPFPLLFPPPF